VPAAWTTYIQLNADRVKLLQSSGGHITEKHEPKLGPGCRQH
jgi:hypothetical protein